MTFGEDWGWDSDKETSKKIYDTFMEADGNFIDTADVNYVRAHSNAVTEGLNNLIRQVKRASWGMPKFQHLRLRVLACNA